MSPVLEPFVSQPCNAPCFPKCPDPAAYTDGLCKNHHMRQERGQPINTPISRRVGRRKVSITIGIFPESQEVIAAEAAKRGMNARGLIEFLLEEWAKTARASKT